MLPDERLNDAAENLRKARRNLDRAIVCVWIAAVLWLIVMLGELAKILQWLSR